jgi:hypothetical protein
MNRGISLIALIITMICIMFLIGIVITSEEPEKPICEFGEHHYICEKCGKEIEI